MSSVFSFTANTAHLKLQQNDSCPVFCISGLLRVKKQREYLWIISYLPYIYTFTQIQPGAVKEILTFTVFSGISS